MRKLFTVFTIFLWFGSFAQAQRSSVGFGSPGPEMREPNPAERQALDQRAKGALIGNEAVRVVDGRIYNASHNTNWTVISGVVYSAVQNLLVIRESKNFEPYGALVAITNCPIYPERQRVSFVAMRSGTIILGDTPVVLWDCGTAYKPPPPTPEQLKLAAIQRVNQYWNIERDRVREETKISLKHPPVSLDGTFSVEIDIVCYVNESHPAPDEINLIFNNVADDWQYLRYSAFIVNYDGEKKDFGELKVQGDVLPSGRVSEIMLANFTYDEFHKMAFSKKVMLDLGTQKNCQITPETRTQWQTLCNYFDLIKSQQKLKESEKTP